MTTAIRVASLDQVIQDLNEQIGRVHVATRRGLIAAGLYIQGESQRRCPVDLGNLKASAFTTWPGKKGAGVKGFKGNTAEVMASNHANSVNSATATVTANSSPVRTVVEVGHSAYYALYVHENMTAKHTVGSAKFLQRAFIEGAPRVIELIREEVSGELKNK